MQRLIRSIWIWTTLFLVAQFGLMTAVVVGTCVPWSAVVAFYPVSLAVHGALGGLMTLLANLFVIPGRDRHLDHVNAANVLTMTRISSTPTVLWLLILTREHQVVVPLIVVTSLVFLTDLLDGQVSRRLGQVTKIGTYLDSISDYSILLAAAVGLIIYGTVAWWFFIVTMVRLGTHVVLQAILFFVQRCSIESKTSLLGKASIFALMSVFAVSLLRLFPAVAANQTFATVLLVAEIVTAAIAGASLIEKIAEFTRDVARATDERAGSNAL